MINQFPGRGRSFRNISIPDGDPPPPPPEGEIVISALAHRVNGSNGAGTAHIICPVPEGVIVTTADLDDIVVKLNTVEQPVELIARGQHPDGSYNIVAGWFSISSILTDSPLAVEIRLRSTPVVARTTIGSGKYTTYSRNGANPRKSGYPDVIVVPTSADYLVTTKFTGPYTLQTAASTIALGGRYATYWHRFKDFSDWWWSTNAGTGPNGTAPGGTNIGSIEACNTNNTTFPSYGNLADSNEDFQNWRIAIGWVTASLYTFCSYDNAKHHIEAWMCTGDKEYLIRGLMIASVYCHEFIKIETLLTGISGIDGFKWFSGTVALYHLIIGDDTAKRILELQNDRWLRALAATHWGTVSVPKGFGFSALPSDPAGSQGTGRDGRDCARAMQAILAAHRIRSTNTYSGGANGTFFPTDYVQKAKDLRDRLLQNTQLDHLRKADGTWRSNRCLETPEFDGEYASNLFMSAMIAVELVMFYEQIEQDPDIVTALEQFWNTIYPTLWGFWAYTFDGDPWFVATVKSFKQLFEHRCDFDTVPGFEIGNTNLLNLMYVTVGAWLFKVTGNAAYKTEADDVFHHGIGTSTNAGSGPVIGEHGSGLNVSRKGFGEHYHLSGPWFTYRLGLS